MPFGKSRRPKVIVVMPAYNAAKTVERTYHDIPKAWVDEVILVDDVSKDETVEVARRLPIKVVVHRENKGYGGNQKTCYTEALMAGAEVVVMLHPDYQYDSRLIPQMVSPILDGHADFVMGSRIIGEGALKGGMPWWKFVANRLLTMAENIVLNRKFSDLHTGFRAYSRRLLMDVPYVLNSDDFVFDSQMIAQANYRGYTTTEVPIPTRYFSEASSVSFRTSTIYGFKTVWVMGQLALQKLGLARYPWLERKLEDVVGKDHREKIFKTEKNKMITMRGGALILLWALCAGTGRAQPMGRVLEPTHGDEFLIAGSGAKKTVDGVGLGAAFTDIAGMALDPVSRSLFVVEEKGHSVRRVDLDRAGGSVVSTVAGSKSELLDPTAIAPMQGGGWAVLDTGRQAFYKVGADGTWQGKLFGLAPHTIPVVATGTARSLCEGWIAGTWLVWDQTSGRIELLSPTAQGLAEIASGQTPYSLGTPRILKQGSDIYWLSSDGAHRMTMTGQSLIPEPPPPKTSEGILWAACTMGDQSLSYEFQKGYFQHAPLKGGGLGILTVPERGPGVMWDQWHKRFFTGRVFMEWFPGAEQIVVGENRSRKIYGVKLYRLNDSSDIVKNLYFPPIKQKGLRRGVVVGASQWYCYDDAGTWKTALRANLARRFEEAVNQASALNGKPENWEFGLLTRGGTEMAGGVLSYAHAFVPGILGNQLDVMIVGVDAMDIQREAFGFLSAQPDADGFAAKDIDPEWLLKNAKDMDLHGFAASMRDRMLEHPTEFLPWFNRAKDGHFVRNAQGNIDFELMQDPAIQKVMLAHYFKLATSLQQEADTKWKVPLLFVILPRRNYSSAGELDDDSLKVEDPQLSQDLVDGLRQRGLKVLDAFDVGLRAGITDFPLFLGGNRHFNEEGAQLLGSWIGGLFLAAEPGWLPQGLTPTAESGK